METDLVERYAGLYPRAYAPAGTQDELAKLVRELVARHGGRSLNPGQARSVPSKPASSPDPTVGQLQLGV